MLFATRLPQFKDRTVAISGLKKSALPTRGVAKKRTSKATEGSDVDDEEDVSNEPVVKKQNKKKSGT